MYISASTRDVLYVHICGQLLTEYTVGPALEASVSA